MKSKIKTFFIAIVAACSALCLTQTTFAVFGKTNEIIKNNEDRICSLTEELNELKKNKQQTLEDKQQIHKDEQQITKLKQKIDELCAINNILKHIKCIDDNIKNLKDKIKNKNLENETIKTLLKDIESYIEQSISDLSSFPLPHLFFDKIDSMNATNNNLEEKIKNETKDEENKKNFLQCVKAISENIKNIKEIEEKHKTNQISVSTYNSLPKHNFHLSFNNDLMLTHTMPDNMPDNMLTHTMPTHKMSIPEMPIRKTPDNMSDNMSDDMSDDWNHDLPIHKTPDNMPDYMSDYISDNISDNMSDNMLLNSLLSFNDDVTSKLAKQFSATATFQESMEKTLKELLENNSSDKVIKNKLSVLLDNLYENLIKENLGCLLHKQTLIDLIDNPLKKTINEEFSKLSSTKPDGLTKTIKEMWKKCFNDGLNKWAKTIKKIWEECITDKKLEL